MRTRSHGLMGSESYGRERTVKKSAVLSIAVLVVLCAALVLRPMAPWMPRAEAMTLKGGESPGVAAGRVINDDLYITGGSVSIDGKVNGDVFVAGGSVSVNGTVRDDLAVAGGNVTVNGAVGGSVRAAGGSLILNGKTGQDLMAFGGTVDMATGSSIGRDAMFGSGNVSLGASVGRDLKGGVGSLTINNSVGRDVDLSADELILTDRADVKGDLTYTSAKKAKIAPAAKVAGRITQNKPAPEEAGAGGAPSFASSAAWFVASYLMAFLFGIVLLALFPARTAEISAAVTTSPWASLGIGLGVLIVVPIAAVILMVFVIPIPISLTALGLYALGIYISKLYVGLAVGRWISHYFKWSIHEILSLVIGLLILMLLGLAPYLGGLLRFSYVLFGLGAISMVLYRTIREGRVGAGEAAPPAEAE